MEKDFAQTDPKLVEYVRGVFKPEDDVLEAVRVESEKRGLPPIQVGSFDGLHLEVLIRLMGARRVVEVGTLGGYSGICLCRGMGPTGRLYTFELSPHHAEVARANFAKAGVLDQVQILVGPASENLSKIEKEGPFDAIFLDADKVGYLSYLEWATNHLRVGGAVIADNTFGFGYLHRPQEAGRNQADVEALREFNRRMAESTRFRATILPTGEGLTVGVKTR